MSSINTNYGNYAKSPVSTTRTYGKKTDDDVKKKPDAASESAAEKTSDKRNKDTLEISGKSPSRGIATEYAGKSALGIKNEGMKNVVAQMLNGQANSASGKSSSIDSILRSYGLEPIKSDGSDDFWGAEKTANRILDFAKSLAGSDPESFKKVKSAFEKGFGECEKMWGGKLPSVCYDTLDRVRKGFDDWEKELGDKSEAAAQ